MDEAERCHALAILDDGVLVAEGAPRDLAARIGAVVLEVETDDMRGARAVLGRVRGLWSVAQMGTRLHALIDPHVADPDASVRAALSQAGVAARVEVAPASLEDVFVAATTARSA
jgi:ABC-2 type transport system ATP-binding protein